MTNSTTGFSLDISPPQYPTLQIDLSQPPLSSEWKCYLFGLGSTGITMVPPYGKEPNWFWRKMQYLIFGNEWVKEKA